MKYPEPLIRGKLIKRYKRFLADMELEDGSHITAHCPNSGAMLGLLKEGAETWLRHYTNTKRALPYSWESVEVEGTLVGVNTMMPNVLVKEALLAKALPEFAHFENMRPEVKYGEGSRIDFLLHNPDQPLCYLEVKNVHTKEGNKALFPDCVTARGAKHVGELVNMVKQGHEAYILYLAQRSDCEVFDVADHLDPTYAKAARQALTQGVKMVCYDCDVTPEGIEIRRSLPVVIK